MKPYSIEEYAAAKALQATEKALSDSKVSYPMPKWYDKSKYGIWLDCISTALSNYMENPPTGNLTFYANPEKYGFRRLSVGEQPFLGDIGQFVDYKGSPNHAVIITGFTKDGKPLVSYSNGFGYYNKNKDLEPDIYYRYIGTDKDREKIDAHNARVEEERRVLNVPKPEPSYVQAVSAEPLPDKITIRR